MSTVVISQPMLFPWPGFFEQLMLADAYIVLDDVQFSKGSFTNRIQLRVGEERRWMSLPLVGQGSFQLIRDLQATATDWRAAHRLLLARSLADAPFRDDALGLLDRVYAHDDIAELLQASIDYPAQYLGIGTARTRHHSSQMQITGNSWQRVLALVQAVGGTRYLTGHGAANYLDHEAFEQAGVSVQYMAYSCTPWPQPASTFTPYVSILDLIGRTGPAAAQYLRPATTPWRDFLRQRSTTA